VHFLERGELLFSRNGFVARWRLMDPIKPYHKIALDLTEGALAAASATSLQSLAIGWAIFRGVKIASDYAQLYIDREERKRADCPSY
jgi:hypothetical protein